MNSWPFEARFELWLALECEEAKCDIARRSEEAKNWICKKIDEDAQIMRPYPAKDQYWLNQQDYLNRIYQRCGDKTIAEAVAGSVFIYSPDFFRDLDIQPV